MMIVEDARMKKRNLIAEATQTNHPLSVPPTPITNNQTGKIGNPYLSAITRTFAPFPDSRHVSWTIFILFFIYFI